MGLFAKKVSEGLTPLDAAKVVGYAQPESYAYTLMKKAKVIKAINEYQKSWFFGTGLALARNTLENILTDDMVSDGVKFNAAKYVIDKTGELTRDDSLNALMDKAVDDMTPDELEIFIKEGRAVLRNSTGIKKIEQDVIDIKPIDVFK